MRFKITEEDSWSEWTTKFAVFPVKVGTKIILWETYEERKKFLYSYDDGIKFRFWKKERRLIDHKIDGHTPIPSPIPQKPIPPPAPPRKIE